MSLEITELHSPDPDGDYKQLKLEKKYKDAYIDRYRRLGYSETECSFVKEEGKIFAVVTLRRDKNQTEYQKLCEIEGQIEELLHSVVKEEPDENKKDKRKLTLSVLFWAGLGLVIAGVIVLICGFMLSILGLALGGWGVVILGAVALIVWSFLRESWRMRKSDKAEDAANPGFGTDEVSRQVEEKLCAADKLRAGIAD
ncbi:MAG: hypothetical protein LUI60_05860 [Clostridia bacterium]|nr:hypothetical protein [Clostridia bacterium]